MARYDIHRAPSGEAAQYLLDVQSELLDIASTRVVVPLFRKSDYPRPAAVLHPVFQVEGEPCVMVTHLIATIETRELGAKVGNLSAEHFTIVAALDKLFSGV